jgi:hypothetical protein
VATINPGASDEALAAMAELTSALGDADKRRSLAATDPAEFAEALKNAGVTVENIPEGVISGLASASEQELVFLSRLSDELVASGLSVRVADKGAPGIL